MPNRDQFSSGDAAYQPASMHAGRPPSPHLFPGLMAASIWMAIRWEAACTYCVTSTRDTTPLVTLVLSPPVG